MSETPASGYTAVTVMMVADSAFHRFARTENDRHALVQTRRSDVEGTLVAGMAGTAGLLDDETHQTVGYGR